MIYIAPEASKIRVGEGPRIPLHPMMDVFGLGLILLQVLKQSSEPVTAKRVSRLDEQEWDTSSHCKIEIVVGSLIM